MFERKRKWCCEYPRVFVTVSFRDKMAKKVHPTSLTHSLSFSIAMVIKTHACPTHNQGSCHIVIVCLLTFPKSANDPYVGLYCTSLLLSPMILAPWLIIRFTIILWSPRIAPCKGVWSNLSIGFGSIFFFVRKYSVTRKLPSAHDRCKGVLRS